MRKLSLVAILLFITIASHAQVNFLDMAYADALSKAKQENKYLFVDCYTSWCVPCKYMANNVFAQKEAGDFMNPRFVAIKIDMEKGEGKDLAKKFNVKAFPTFLVISNDGQIQHRVVGKKSWEDFQKCMERGLNPETSLAGLDAKCKAGNITNEVLMAYKVALQDAFMTGEAAAVDSTLAASQCDSQKLQASYWTMIANKKSASLGSDNYKYILSHLDEYRKIVGDEAVGAYLYDVWDSSLSDYYFVNYQNMVNKDPKNLNFVREAVKQYPIPQGDVLLKKCDLAEKCIANDTVGFVALANSIIDNVPPFDEGNMLGSLVMMEPSFKNHKQFSAWEADEYYRYLARIPEANQPEWVSHNAACIRKTGYVGTFFEDYDFKKALFVGDSRWQFPVFVWVYTAKDKATKQLEKVFAQENVGDAAKAVCVKYDIDSADGQAVKQKYNVTDKQTLLILGSDGTEKARLTGKQTAETLINWFGENLKSDK